jgi:hypothetical protein
MFNVDPPFSFVRRVAAIKLALMRVTPVLGRQIYVTGNHRF